VVTIADEPLQNSPRGAVTTPVEARDQLDHIAAAAAGKASPQALAAADHKGVRVVAAVQGTRPDKIVASNAKTAEQASTCEDLLDGHDAFEFLKRAHGHSS